MLATPVQRQPASTAPRRSFKASSPRFYEKRTRGRCGLGRIAFGRGAEDLGIPPWAPMMVPSLSRIEYVEQQPPDLRRVHIHAGPLSQYFILFVHYSHWTVDQRDTRARGVRRPHGQPLAESHKYRALLIGEREPLNAALASALAVQQNPYPTLSGRRACYFSRVVGAISGARPRVSSPHSSRHAAHPAAAPSRARSRTDAADRITWHRGEAGCCGLAPASKPRSGCASTIRASSRCIARERQGSMRTRLEPVASCSCGVKIRVSSAATSVRYSPITTCTLTVGS